MRRSKREQMRRTQIRLAIDSYDKWLVKLYGAGSFFDKDCIQRYEGSMPYAVAWTETYALSINEISHMLADMESRLGKRPDLSPKALVEAYRVLLVLEYGS